LLGVGGPRTQFRYPAPKPVVNATFVADVEAGAVEEGRGDTGKDKAAQALGRRGGFAHRDRLTPERRAEIARNAAAVRWGRFL
jgi:hypothetical protein